MENLRNKLDSLSIEQLFKEVDEFIGSAEKYDNSLKLVFILMHITQKCTSLLSTIDMDDFESTVSKRIEEVTAECKQILEEKSRENMANKDLIHLADGAQSGELAEKIALITSQIDEVNGKLTDLMKIRENTPVGERV